MKMTTAVPYVHSNPVRALVHRPGLALAIFALMHPLLALAMRASDIVATVHALLTVLTGVWIALLGKDLRKVGFVAAYVTGAEVLWRMTEARIFWESGKYFTIFLLLIALLRHRRWRRAHLPILYFLLLCLSLPITFLELGSFPVARQLVSFNMSGPLALSVAALYFSQISLDPVSFRRLIWWMVIPILGIAAITLYSTVSAGQISFTLESNFVTSGGFGPNQVSAALGLGGGVLLLLAWTGRGLSRWLFLVLLAIGLLALSALTFSRGGVYNAAMMLVLALAHSLRSARGKLAVLLTLFVAGLVGGYVVLPRLNAFTGGLLGQRFAELDTTRRAEIARADLALWSSHPLLGVGPGMAKTNRLESLGFLTAAHTEYTRMLGEHGAAGLLALLLLLVMALRAYIRAPGRDVQYWVAALLAWPLMEMTHAAMRIVAISFLFGLAMVNWETMDNHLQDRGSDECYEPFHPTRG